MIPPEPEIANLDKLHYEFEYGEPEGHLTIKLRDNAEALVYGVTLTGNVARVVWKVLQDSWGRSKPNE